MILYIPQSKTDQLRKGNEMIIARTGNPTCPVAMLESYLARTGMQLSDQRLLFRLICKTAKSETLRESGSISYSCLRELFWKKLKDLGYITQTNLAYTVCGLEVLQQQLMVGCLTGFSNVTVGGNLTQLRMAMWRTLLTAGWRSPNRLVCNYSFLCALCVVINDE